MAILNADDTLDKDFTGWINNTDFFDCLSVALSVGGNKET